MPSSRVLIALSRAPGKPVRFFMNPMGAELVKVDFRKKAATSRFGGKRGAGDHGFTILARIPRRYRQCARRDAAPPSGFAAPHRRF